MLWLCDKEEPADRFEGEWEFEGAAAPLPPPPGRFDRAATSTLREGAANPGGAWLLGGTASALPCHAGGGTGFVALLPLLASFGEDACCGCGGGVPVAGGDPPIPAGGEGAAGTLFFRPGCMGGMPDTTGAGIAPCAAVAVCASLMAAGLLPAAGAARAAAAAAGAGGSAAAAPKDDTRGRGSKDDHREGVGSGVQEAFRVRKCWRAACARAISGRRRTALGARGARMLLLATGSGLHQHATPVTDRC